VPRVSAFIGRRELVTLLGGAEFGNYIVQYTEKWAKVIKFAGIKPE
jgi:hypothetical protein